MGEPVTAQCNRHHAAGLELPTPLYALYCELEAYQTASGEAEKQLTLEIVDAVGVKHAGALRKRAFPAALERQEHAPAAVKRQKAPSRSPSANVNYISEYEQYDGYTRRWRADLSENRNPTLAEIVGWLAEADL
ncbi:hypothetical protein PF005_g30463 [Phytophthora fragariae]|uniref:Uncharacterized protein n=1 Tax=Phytophthora fragariae TaxID=53985 RepID=A0A6A3PHY7_9STRA|nr:hypothetical protein PF003_g40291 [Phytophthora fragariae]KAE8917303.1 hypothetical protein PF009_g32376 [Phytophthora fragariae]KAE9056759.1 hypothetical protein PF010_g31641 [Phytophthora fragariae]KAE9057600.1 hypothetical protein PF007_g31591 [Phytophthora fragariae]KAE9060266.1 hypothetical protein PF006_g31684 [Phytophthora fragariae]